TRKGGRIQRGHNLFHLRQRTRYAHHSSVHEFFQEVRRVLLDLPPEARFVGAFQNDCLAPGEFAPAALNDGGIRARLQRQQVALVTQLPGCHRVEQVESRRRNHAFQNTIARGDSILQRIERKQKRGFFGRLGQQLEVGYGDGGQ